MPSSFIPRNETEQTKADFMQPAAGWCSAGPGISTATAMPLPAGAVQQHVISHCGRLGNSNLQGAASRPTGRNLSKSNAQGGWRKHWKGE